MLKSIFGNKSVERILMFLLVNEKCYAHQIHRTLSIPITPIQKGLTRLEEGGVLNKHKEGKISWYFFNLDYPLIPELEGLLKKAYNHLSVEEKKAYYYFGNLSRPSKRNQQDLLTSTWEHLKNVSQVTLLVTSYSKGNNQWQRKGIGKVSVQREGRVIEFDEQGQWDKERSLVESYTNRFRWMWDYRQSILSLEHLRLGKKNPVFLFNLMPTEEHFLKSVKPHLCGQDTYYGWLERSDLFIQLNIRTIGPNKNEEIKYIYT